MVKTCHADDITSCNLCRRSLRNVVAEMYKNESNLRNCRNVTWNEHGSGLMFEDFNIPIVKLQNGSDVDFIKKVSSSRSGLTFSILSAFFRHCMVFYLS